MAAERFSTFRPRAGELSDAQIIQLERNPDNFLKDNRNGRVDVASPAGSCLMERARNGFLDHVKIVWDVIKKQNDPADAITYAYHALASAARTTGEVGVVHYLMEECKDYAKENNLPYDGLNRGSTMHGLYYGFFDAALKGHKDTCELILANVLRTDTDTEVEAREAIAKYLLESEYVKFSSPEWYGLDMGFSEFDNEADILRYKLPVFADSKEYKGLKPNAIIDHISKNSEKIIGRCLSSDGKQEASLRVGVGRSKL